MALGDDLDALPSDLLARLSARGFRRDRLLSWADRVGQDRDLRNRLSGEVLAPGPGDVVDLPAAGTPEHEALRQLGLEALRGGRVALCVLAGGMATRMGGVVKALVEALPGKTFLDLRLAEQAAVEREVGCPVPLWLMTSEATHRPIVEALGARLDGERVAVFEQCVSLRLTPEGALFRDDAGQPSVHASGHGDLPEALAASGLCKRFRARHTGSARGPFVWLANLDNLGASVDPAVLGFHVSHGGPLTVELVDKVGTDRGGGPIRWNGRRTICEEMRLPVGFDPTTVPVFNTNTFLVDAQALDELDFDFTFIEVEKTVDGRKAVQFERLLGEITVPLEPHLLRVPRSGVASRFLPVKDQAELAARRPEIEALARAHGWLGGAS